MWVISSYGHDSKFAAGAGSLLYYSASAGPLVQNSAGVDQQAQQWMITCSLSVNTARRLSKHTLTKLSSLIITAFRLLVHEI